MKEPPGDCPGGFCILRGHEIMPAENAYLLSLRAGFIHAVKHEIQGYETNRNHALKNESQKMLSP